MLNVDTSGNMEEAITVQRPLKLLVAIVFNKRQKKVQSVRTSDCSSSSSNISANKPKLFNKSSTTTQRTGGNYDKKTIQIKIKLNVSDDGESNCNGSFPGESYQNLETFEVDSTIKQTETIRGLPPNGTILTKIANQINEVKKNIEEAVLCRVLEKEKGKIQNVTELIKDYDPNESHNRSIWQTVFKNIESKRNYSKEDRNTVDVIHELIMEKYQQTLNKIKQRIEHRDHRTMDLTSNTLNTSKNDKLDLQRSLLPGADESDVNLFMNDKNSFHKKEVILDDIFHKDGDYFNSTFINNSESNITNLNTIIEQDEYVADTALEKEMVTTTSKLQNEQSLYVIPELEEKISENEADRSIGSSDVSLLISESDGRQPALTNIFSKTKICDGRKGEQKVINDHLSSNWLISSKYDNLTKKFSLQDEIIQQSAKAVKICRLQPQFFGNNTLVEAEKILLIANLRKEAIKNKLKKLEYEETDYQSTSSTVKIHNINFYSKSQLSEQNKNCNWYYICILHEGSTVYATKTSLQIKNTISFEDVINFENITSEFQINVSVYCLLQKNKKFKQKCREEPNFVQSSTCSSTNSYFALCGVSIIRPSQTHQTLFKLSKKCTEVPIINAFKANVETIFKIHVKEAGFLTLGIDYKGHPVWNRRWCLLKGSVLRYWNSPNEEDTSPPLGEIDFQNCVSYEIRRAEKDICPSPRTLVFRINIYEDATKIQRRYFLSADNYVDFDKWLRELNIVLHYLRKWSYYKSHKTE